MKIAEVRITGRTKQGLFGRLNGALRFSHNSVQWYKCEPQPHKYID